MSRISALVGLRLLAVGFTLVGCAGGPVEGNASVTFDTIPAGTKPIVVAGENATFVGFADPKEYGQHEYVGQVFAPCPEKAVDYSVSTGFDGLAFADEKCHLTDESRSTEAGLELRVDSIHKILASVWILDGDPYCTAEIHDSSRDLGENPTRVSIDCNQLEHMVIEEYVWDLNPGGRK